MRNSYCVTLETTPSITAIVTPDGFRHFNVSVHLTETSNAAYQTDPAAKLRHEFAGGYDLAELPSVLRDAVEAIDASDLARRQELASALDADLVSVREDGDGNISFRFGGKDFSVSKQSCFGFAHPKAACLPSLLGWAKAASLGDWEHFVVSGGTASSGRSVTIICHGSVADRRKRDRRKLEDVLRKSPHVADEVIEFARKRGFIK
ncbi:hypothetical protein JT06_18285 [Desulfobulbus sp. Tol-SR]|nr:hypothetical protein JT06_18285 [Desulfobulbus sp. Tol-SR]